MLEMDRTEEVIREMDRLANGDHTHIATEEEFDVYRGNWWIRSNFVGSDTMPIRHRFDFKEVLLTLRRLKNAEDQAYYQNWWQSSSSVKSTCPTTENWLRKLCMTRYPTRARCTICEHALRARSFRHTLMLGHMHHLVQVLSPVMSSMYMCVSP